MSSTALTPRQKAAIVVKLLLDDEEGLELSALDEDIQVLLTQEMAQMELIDRATRDAVISEFCDSLERIGVTFPGDLDATLDLLGQQISADTSDRLRRSALLNGRGDPWERVGNLPIEKLTALANSEAVELIALMLTRLPVATASELFSSLTKERARSVALAMSMTGKTAGPALQRIGLILLQAAEALPPAGSESSAVERVGAILNFATADLRDEILEGLDQDDAQFAGGVRKAIFTFNHIPERVESSDIPRIMRDVENDVLVRALAGASESDAPTVDFILSNLPKRLSENLRGDIESAAAIHPKDAAKAKTAIVAAIRQLVDAGEISFLAEPDEEGQAA